MRPFRSLVSSLLALTALTGASGLPAHAHPRSGRLGYRQCHGKGGHGAPGTVTVHNFFAHEGQGQGPPTNAVVLHAAQQTGPRPAPVDGNEDQGGGGETMTIVKTVIVTAGGGPVTENAIATGQPSPQPQPQPKPKPKPNPQPQPKPNTQPSPKPAPAPTDGGEGGGNKVNDSGRVGKISPQDPKQLLKLHNDYRAARGKSPLTWDDKQAEFAANSALDCKFQHSGGPYGENIAAGGPAGSAASGFFNSWTNEEKNYDPNAPTYSHYTQVVWAATKRLGCALVDCPMNTAMEGFTSTYLICEYDVGNIIGAAQANV